MAADEDAFWRARGWRALSDLNVITSSQIILKPEQEVAKDFQMNGKATIVFNSPLISIIKDVSYKIWNHWDIVQLIATTYCPQEFANVIATPTVCVSNGQYMFNYEEDFLVELRLCTF